MEAFETIVGRLDPVRERALIKAARSGCQRSAHELILAHQDRLNAFVWRMVRNSHDAEEICQDAFLRAFAALDTFDYSYRFSTWLFTIGYRLCLNCIRKRREVATALDLGALAASAPGAGGAADDPPDEVANSDEARRLKKVIWESVDQLTPAQRATVLLFYRESMSCQEIGEVLGTPASTIKSHLHRARNRLRDLLSEHLADDWSVVRFSEEAGAG